MIFRRTQFLQLRLVIKIYVFSPVCLVLLHHWLYDRKDIRPVQTLTAIRLGSLLGDSLSWDQTYDGVISRRVCELTTTKRCGDIDNPGDSSSCLPILNSVVD